MADYLYKNEDLRIIDESRPNVPFAPLGVLGPVSEVAKNAWSLSTSNMGESVATVGGRP